MSKIRLFFLIIGLLILVTPMVIIAQAAGESDIAFAPMGGTPTPTATEPAPTPTPTKPPPVRTPRPEPGGPSNPAVSVLLSTAGTMKPWLDAFLQEALFAYTRSSQLASSSGSKLADFNGIDFTPGSQAIKMKIIPADKSINQGEPIEIEFIPGKECVFGDKQACVATYQPSSKGNVIFISVHSGFGGEAQALRHALEGTKVTRADFSLKDIQKNLQNMARSIVTLQQGSRTVTNLQIETMARVPTRSIKEYFLTPIDEALAFAAATNPQLEHYLTPGETQIVIETCGWRVVGEPWAEGVKMTTAGVYLGIIQQAT